MTTDALYTELRRLSRGRGLATADLASLAAWLPGDREQVVAGLRQRIDRLAPDLRLAALAALGLHPAAGERFLGQRISWLAGQLDRDARTVRRRIDEAFRLIAASLGPVAMEERVVERLSVPFLAGSVTVDLCPIELLTGVDAVVAAGNTHLEQAQTYKSSTSAALRRAAAHRGAAGEITDDVLQRELAAWVARHSRPGLAVAPGTVVPLSPGALASRGVRRVFYAAIATARPGSNDYDIDRPAVAAAVTNIFAAALADPADPPLRSVALPILGSGRGGLAAEESIAWMRTALTEVLAGPVPWRVHLATRSPTTAALLTERFTAA
ncbi:Appr-1-p processing protein [Thermomonospora umbrina]|nr:Appr-1-p processing protein [Thermomonospora umbrina]